ncbi:MAG: GRRM system radical SAM/SPASM domain protein [Anaerolinea sp.]|nr:GRRM system radical SAM/SPASM domain protein [Anaerolinea sp.]
MSTSLPSLELLVLQPTPFCNINCSYCYLPDRTNKKTMSEEILAKIFSRIFESGIGDDGFTVVWHAGEPLVLPPEWYGRACDILDAHNGAHVPVRHNIQSNGLLLGDRWAAFIRAKDFHIGLSIDGPRALHDARRRTRSGRGTFDGAIRAVERLQRFGIDFHVITVLSWESLQAPDLLFDFYRDHGIRDVAFNIEEIEGGNVQSSLDRPDAVPAFKKFLRRFIERMSGEPETLELREVAGALAVIFRGNDRVAVNQQTEPLAIVCVDVDGNIGTFSPELLGLRHSMYRGFTFGNVQTTPLRSILDDQHFRCVRDDIAAGVRLCAGTCPYFNVCRGGAPANKLFENGSFASTETLFCRLTKQALIDVMLEDLEFRLGLGKPTLGSSNSGHLGLGSSERP